MTIREKLDTMEGIKESNRQYVIRWKAKHLHKKCVKNGMMEEAWYILRLLRKGRVTVYLDDISMNTEFMLTDIGCVATGSRNGYTATIRI